MLTLMLFAGIFTTSVQTPWTSRLGIERDAGLSPPIEVTLDLAAETITIGPWDFTTNAMSYTYQVDHRGTPAYCSLTECFPAVPGTTTTHVDTLDPVRFVSLVPIELPINRVWITGLSFDRVAHQMAATGTKDGIPWNVSNTSQVSAQADITRDSTGAIVGFNPELYLGNTVGTSAVPEPSAFMLLGLVALGIYGTKFIPRTRATSNG